MRKNFRKPTAVAATVLTVFLAVTAGECNSGNSTTGGTTGGTSGTNGGTSGGAGTENPRIFVAPGVCYKGEKAKLTISGGYPLGEYPVKIVPANDPSKPAVKTWVQTTDDSGDASWELNCSSIPPAVYSAVMTWKDGKKSSTAPLDVLDGPRS